MPDFSSRDLWFRGELCSFWVLISEGHFCRCPHAARTPVLCAPLCPHCCSPTLLLCSSLFFSGLFPPLWLVGGTSTSGCPSGDTGGRLLPVPTQLGAARALQDRWHRFMLREFREPGVVLCPPHSTQGRCAFHFVTWVGFTLPAAPHLPHGDVNKHSPGSSVQAGSSRRLCPPRAGQCRGGSSF